MVKEVDEVFFKKNDSAKKFDDSVKAENKMHISTIENALNKDHKI